MKEHWGLVFCVHIQARTKHAYSQINILYILHVNIIIVSNQKGNLYICLLQGTKLLAIIVHQWIIGKPSLEVDSCWSVISFLWSDACLWRDVSFVLFGTEHMLKWLASRWGWIFGGVFVPRRNSNIYWHVLRDYIWCYSHIFINFVEIEDTSNPFLYIEVGSAWNILFALNFAPFFWGNFVPTIFTLKSINQGIYCVFRDEN